MPTPQIRRSEVQRVFIAYQGPITSKWLRKVRTQVV